MTDLPNHEKVKKQKIHLPLSAWLSYLVVITILFGSVSLARYTASTTDSDAARVAKFEVSASSNGDPTNKVTLSTTTLNSVTYTFAVKNTSEVAVKYIIIVKNVPEDVDVSVNGSEFLQPDNGTVTYAAADVLGINAEKNDCTISFKAHDEYAAINKYEEKITVEIRFDQVD